MRIPAIIITLAAAAMLAACTSQKDPAEKAVAKIEASLNEIRSDAQVYAADQLLATETSVDRLKAAVCGLAAAPP